MPLGTVVSGVLDFARSASVDIRAAGGAHRRVLTGRSRSRFMGIRDLAGIRKPYSPGWAPVGDAGYNKASPDRDAEGVLAAMDDFFAERES
jgi:hypothetical protein